MMLFVLLTYLLTSCLMFQSERKKVKEPAARNWSADNESENNRYDECFELWHILSSSGFLYVPSVVFKFLF